MKKVVNLTSLLLVIFLFLFPVKVCADTPFYTVQVLTAKKRQEAEKAFDKVKEYKDARIDYVNKFYKVRIGLFKKRKEAYSFLKDHPEIKKLFPSTYITLNYYNPKRTIKRGSCVSEKDSVDEGSLKAVKSDIKSANENKTEKTSPIFQMKKQEERVKVEAPEETYENRVLETKRKKGNFVKHKDEKNVYFVIGFFCGVLTVLLAFFIIKKECLICEKVKEVYVYALKNLPVKTARKILEHHYTKVGDFKSLLLLKLKENDMNFVLREAPKYLFKHKDDILVWKIYIETLANFGSYLDAADACEKLAEIFQNSHRPEAAISYRRKAEEYRKKASMKLGNQA